MICSASRRLVLEWVFLRTADRAVWAFAKGPMARKYSDFPSPTRPPAVIRGLAAPGRVHEPYRRESQSHWAIMGIRLSHLGSRSRRPTAPAPSAAPAPARG